MSEAERAGASRQDENARLLAGRYRLGDVLGRGGMGTVWRAEDETLGRTVAVKELRFPSNIDEEEKRRLITRTLREAKAIARIRHNSAVTVFDVVEEDDRPWIVMELVEGKSLAEAIREDGLLAPRRAAEVGLAVLDVLRSAHRQGILHRDVKPSNVLIADDGRVVLTDFGIAQVEGDPSITSTGMLVGAPSYIAPERARGHKPGPAADLWSLGGLLYAAVEGVPPYDKGSAIATLTAVMTEPLDEPKNAGPLAEVIRGLLTKDPAERLDDAGARALLDAVVEGLDRAGEEPQDATRAVPLPAQTGPGGRRGEAAAGTGLRGALRSVRRGSAGQDRAAGAAATAPEAASATAAKTPPATPETPATPATPAGSAKPAPAAAARPAEEAGPGEAAAGGPGGRTPAGGRSTGWPVVPPPDLPARPARRAPLTDVVSRRTLVIIAVAVVLAVLGTVLALTLGGGDADSAGPGRDTGSSAGASGADTRSDRAGGSGPDGGNSPSAGRGTQSGASGAATPGAAADGDGPADGSGDAASHGSDDADGSGDGAATTHRGAQGYSIGLPEGWAYKSTGNAGDRFTGPGGQKLLIGWTSTPKDDPVADWHAQERYMKRSQYQRIRIASVDYRGWDAADWEFTYTEGGTRFRSVDRGFVVDDHQGYALMYTAEADSWNGAPRRDTWLTLTKTFRPKD